MECLFWDLMATTAMYDNTLLKCLDFLRFFIISCYFGSIEVILERARSRMNIWTVGLVLLIMLTELTEKRVTCAEPQFPSSSRAVK
jgi:hypothetical protein